MDQAAEEILLYLFNCLDEGISYKAKKDFYLLDVFAWGRKNIGPNPTKNGIKSLSKNKFIEKKKSYDGSVIVSLTERGALRALNLVFRRFDVKKEKWDGKWRMIAFDIPNECVKGRKALVYRFRSGGFYELQKSLFLYPYDCEKEVKALAELFKLEKYVKFGLLDYIDNQENMKVRYKLN